MEFCLFSPSSFISIPLNHKSLDIAFITRWSFLILGFNLSCLLKLTVPTPTPHPALAYYTPFYSRGLCGELPTPLMVTFLKNYSCSAFYSSSPRRIHQKFLFDGSGIARRAALRQFSVCIHEGSWRFQCGDFILCWLSHSFQRSRLDFKVL